MNQSRPQGLSFSRPTTPVGPEMRDPGNEVENWTLLECIYNLDFPGLGWISLNFKARPMFPLILILPWKKAWWKTKRFVNVEHEQLNTRA